MLNDGNLDAGESYLREDLIIDDAILLTDAKDSSDLHLMSWRYKVQSGEGHSLEGHDFGCYGEALIAKDPV